MTIRLYDGEEEVGRSEEITRATLKRVHDILAARATATNDLESDDNFLDTWFHDVFDCYDGVEV